MLRVTVTVATELGRTSTYVLPITSRVVNVLAPAPEPAFVCPLLLAPGPDIGLTEPVIERVLVVDAGGMVMVTVFAVMIGLMV